jgi:hypothetical protein
VNCPDGVNILPPLYNQQLPSRNYYLHFPHYSPQRGKPGAVVISGNYKLIEWYEGGKVELYDLSKDEGEKNNIAEAYSDVVNQLGKDLYAWRKNIGSKMCTPNPVYTGKEAVFKVLRV